MLDSLRVLPAMDRGRLSRDLVRVLWGPVEVTVCTVAAACNLFWQPGRCQLSRLLSTPSVSVLVGLESGRTRG